MNLVMSDSYMRALGWLLAQGAVFEILRREQLAAFAKSTLMFERHAALWLRFALAACIKLDFEQSTIQRAVEERRFFARLETQAAR
jgi:hypothetical protein